MKLSTGVLQEAEPSAWTSRSCFGAQLMTAPLGVWAEAPICLEAISSCCLLKSSAAVFDIVPSPIAIVDNFLS